MTEPSTPQPQSEPEPTTVPKQPKASKRGPLIFAFVVMIVGVWLLLEAFGVNVPSFSKIWPAFLLVGGAASLLDYLTISKRPRALGHTVFGFLSGAVGFVLSSGNPSWSEFLNWLPSLPVIVGLAMLTTWAAAGQKDKGLLTGAIAIIAVGLLGYFARFDFLRDLLPSAQVVWAVGLIVVGILVTWRVYNRPS